MLRLKLHQVPPRLSADHELMLRVGPRQVDVLATLNVDAPDADLARVEVLLNSPQPLIVTQVVGAGVHRWNQTDQRLLIWLERTAASARLEVTGWLIPAMLNGATLPYSAVGILSQLARGPGTQSAQRG